MPGSGPQRMDDATRSILLRAANEHATPAYVYFLDRVRDRFDRVRDAFDGRFTISYAVKSNPCVPLMERFLDKVTTLDVSSIGEAERGLHAGCAPERMTFSGPAKRRFELERAVEIGLGEMVCESVHELEMLNEIAGAAGKTMDFLPRINPKRAPRKFGVQFAGKPSQFGIDEEVLESILPRFAEWSNLRLIGFHIYSGTGSLDPEAISENFGIFIELFTRFCEAADLTPRKLIFGSGFGIPYYPDDEPLDLDRLSSLINPQIDAMRTNPRLAEAELVLEMGRYLVGPEGYLITRVIGEKSSRGAEIRMCDAGFNNQLAACGMMGSIIRRNWIISNVSAGASREIGEYVLVGPLCTSIDTLASDIDLPEVRVGDVLSVASSGAYGLSSSPTRFISHPEPREILVVGSSQDATLIDVTETPLRHFERPIPLASESHHHA